MLDSVCGGLLLCLGGARCARGRALPCILIGLVIEAFAHGAISVFFAG